jgi:chromosome segregation ATPase
MDQAHEEAISELMVGMESSQSDAVQQLQKKYDALVAQLESTHAAHAAELEALKQGDTERKTGYKDLQTRHDKAIAEVETHSKDVERLKETIAEVEAERDEARQAAQEAEDRIETMKGEVVRKHLARVEPLEKQNAALTDKIERLEAIIAAGDRVARAAATMGEKRNMNTLAEEDEDEDEDDTATGAQHLPKVNGQPNDVIGTVS